MSITPKFYNHLLYTEEIKAYIRKAVYAYFNNTYFKFSEFYDLRYDIYTKFIYDILDYLNITKDQPYVDIVYQYCMLYLIDHITSEPPDIPINFKQTVSYNNFNAVIDQNKFNISNFPNGFVIMPSLVPLPIMKRITTMFGHLLDNGEGMIKFSLTDKDEMFGDRAPEVLRCINNSIVENLYQNFISSFEKSKVTIIRYYTMNMKKMLSSDVTELLILFEVPVNVSIKELNLNVMLAEGSFLILNGEALSYNVMIENMDKVPAKIFVFS